jgi:hypothetical protein
MGDTSASPRDIFAEACKRAFADGVVDPGENEALRGLARDLAIPPRVALEIARLARDSAYARPETIQDDAGDSPRPASWNRWTARLWSRPIYTVLRLVDGASPYRKACAIRKRISRLARRAPAAALLQSVVDRVTTAAEILWDLDEELDQLVAYLARRGHPGSSPRRQGARPDSPIDAMVSRRSQLSAAVARMVGDLQRLEDRVAAYVLARRDGLPRRMESELEQALAELDIVSAVVR